MPTCIECGGSQVCPYCGGNGFAFGGYGPTHCGYCKGNGVCFGCHSGVLEYPFEKRLREKTEQLKERRIQSQAGNPDPAEGCRQVIATAQKALEGKG